MSGAPLQPALNPAMLQRFRASNLRLNRPNAYGVIFNGAAGEISAISAKAADTGTTRF